jgi:hypothetical protein
VLFVTVLYIHVIATLSLVSVITAEWLASAHLGRAAKRRDLGLWLDSSCGTGLLGAICLAVLFFSGGYLADRASLWRMAWPKAAVAIVVAFGALSGLSSRRLRKLRRVHALSERTDAEVTHSLQAPFFRTSLSIRSGLVLAGVLLMIAKPDLLNSLWIVLAFVVFSGGLAALQPGPRPASAPAGPALGQSSAGRPGEARSNANAWR